MVPALVSWVAVVGCENKQPPRRIRDADKPVVASRPGIVQVGGPHDVVTDEATACSRFRNALQAGIERLGCRYLEAAECPELVHPLVELPCVMYSEPSVTECERMFAAATTCEELGPGGCVLTAILDPTDSNGIPLDCPQRDATDTTDWGTTSPTDASVDASPVDAGGKDASVDASIDAGFDNQPSNSGTSSAPATTATSADEDAAVSVELEASADASSDASADASSDASRVDAALEDELNAG